LYYYQRLRDLREDNDLTQADVAKILGTAREQYNKYELGKQEIPFHHVITLAKLYNVTIDYLADLTDTPKKLR
jgi:transcriptional regulator with XRE-family HTH domain